MPVWSVSWLECVLVLCVWECVTVVEVQSITHVSANNFSTRFCAESFFVFLVLVFSLHFVPAQQNAPVLNISAERHV